MKCINIFSICVLQCFFYQNIFAQVNICDYEVVEKTIKQPENINYLKRVAKKLLMVHFEDEFHNKDLEMNFVKHFFENRSAEVLLPSANEASQSSLADKISMMNFSAYGESVVFPIGGKTHMILSPKLDTEVMINAFPSSLSNPLSAVPVINEDVDPLFPAYFQHSLSISSIVSEKNVIKLKKIVERDYRACAFFINSNYSLTVKNLDRINFQIYPKHVSKLYKNIIATVNLDDLTIELVNQKKEALKAKEKTI